VIQIDEKMNTPGMVKNLLAASLWTRGAMWKEVIVVDDDIDITNSDEVDWAVVTRVQAARDISILSGGQGSRLDPSSDAYGVTDKLFIDATKKRGFRGTVAQPTNAMMGKIESRWKEYGFR
jgi:2,5-furandicarboxylate decarboxylase 1